MQEFQNSDKRERSLRNAVVNNLGMMRISVDLFIRLLSHGDTNSSVPALGERPAASDGFRAVPCHAGVRPVLRYDEVRRSVRRKSRPIRLWIAFARHSRRAVA